MKYSFCILSLVLSFSTNLLFSQISAMQVKAYNFQSFTEQEKDISPELEVLTPDNYKSHPEYGKLPHNTPCQDCYELLQKRTVNTRYFVTKGSAGTEFHTQTAYGPLHYLDNSGNWVSYDPRLKEVETGVYRSDKQETPIEFSVKDEQTCFYVGSKKIVLNNNLELLYVDSYGGKLSAGKANWSNVSVGEEGVYITNAWPNIDIEIMTMLDKIKSNFIIKNKLKGIEKYNYIVIKDAIELPTEYSISKGEGASNAEGLWEGSLSITSSTENFSFDIGTSVGYDQSGIKQHTKVFGYEFSNGHYSQYIPVKWLEQTSLVYPLTIDPTVTSSATYTAGVMEFRYDGDFCGGSNGACTYNLTVARPANSTLTAATFNAQYLTSSAFCFGCWMSEAGFQIIGPCNTSPSTTTYWRCNNNSPGSCTGTGISLFSTVNCLSPACSGNITFTMSNSYCYCSTGGTCGGAVPCQTMANSSWSITLTGNTLETLGNTATGNGIYNYGGTCSGTQVLNPNGSNGVPGYTYLWSPGGQTSPTITVNNWPNATYTCTVTDACGVSRVATFNINCPLPIEMLNFDVTYNGNNVELNWKTASEINNSHFDIERSADGKTFKKIATIEGNGTSNVSHEYKYVDADGVSGGIYYRLKQVDYDGLYEYSEVKYVYASNSNDVMNVYPNPAENSVTLEFNSYQGKAKSISFMNSLGQVLLEKQIDVVNGANKVEVDINSLPKGNYFILLKEDVILYKSKLVIAR